jgi:hypothetical protein
LRGLGARRQTVAPAQANTGWVGRRRVGRGVAIVELVPPEGTKATIVFRPGMGLLSPSMALSTCPSCGSRFLQPLRCEPQGDQDVLVDLRCPECMTHLQAPYTRADMAELDRRQSEWREEIVAAYERSVTENMEALAACLVPALDRDLIGADDFALPRRAA